MTDALSTLVNEHDKAHADRRLRSRGPAQDRTVCVGCGRPYTFHDRFEAKEAFHDAHDCPERKLYWRRCDAQPPAPTCPSCGGEQFAEVTW